MTFDGSPSIPSTNQPPSPSRVNPGHLQWFAAGDVGPQLRVRRRGEMHCGASGLAFAMGDFAVAEPQQAVPGVQLAGPAAHQAPLAHGGIGRSRLAAEPAVEAQHRITAKDNAIGRDTAVEFAGDAFGLGPGEGAHHVVGRRVRAQAGDDGVLVDARHPDQRFDAGLAQHREPARGRRPEHQPGHCLMWVICCRVIRW